MAHVHVPHDIPVKFLDRSKGFKMFAAALAIIGAVIFGMGLTTNPDAAWQGYVVSWLFFTSVAMGATLFAVVTHITKAKWNWSIRRVSLAFVAFLPIAFVLLLPMLTLGESYFPWIEMMATDPLVQAKAAYLNRPFLIVRQVVGAALLFGLALYFAKLALRPDMGLTKGASDDDKGRHAWRTRLMDGWSGQESEEVRSYQRMTRLGPVIVLLYAVVMSMFTIDWAMSLEPHWFSTMFGPWFFMGAFWAGIAATAFVVARLKAKSATFNTHMGRQQLHDLGKLAFAFTVFWTYLFFSQYIVIWYGKLPWEQAWIIRRSLPETWGPISGIVILMCFVIPFAALIGRKAKMNPTWFSIVSLVILAGLWLERYLLVVPSLHHEGDPLFTLYGPGVALMFLGLFLLSVRWFLETFPVIQLWQPMVDPEPVEAEMPRREMVGAEG